MPRATPAVSIGLPVYNGETHLAQALDSLLAQTCTDFEIVVSDNASQDATREICEAYAARDPRVRYVRQARNIGAPRNWNAVVHEASGQYFKWASANDYCNPAFIESCVASLAVDDRLVLAFGTTMLIDEETGAAREYEGDVEVLDERASQRFARVCGSWALNNAQSGVFRLDVLRRTQLDRPYIGGDLMLMAELSLHGRFKRVPEAVLYRRIDGRSLSARLSPRQLRQFIDPNSTERLVVWPRHRDAFSTVWRTSMPARDKVACMGVVARQASWDRARLVGELGMLMRSGLGLQGNAE
jgi:glycosyltransferase involved in cell wall biosynthesis